MINLFNYTENEISDVVNGEQIVVPPKGQASTSEKKATRMCELHRGSLGLTPKATYDPAAYERVEALKKQELVAFARKLMSGERPDPAAFKKDDGKARMQEGQNQANTADAQA